MHPQQRWRRTTAVLALVTALVAVFLTSSDPVEPGFLSRGSAGASAAPGATDSYVSKLQTAAVSSTPSSGPETTIRKGFISLSVESADFSQGFSADTPGLVGLLRKLHPGFLRVGANTGDYGILPDSVLRRIGDLSSAAHVPIVLELPQRTLDVGRSAQQALRASKLLGRALIGIEFGNETDAYGRNHQRPLPWTYSNYVGERTRMLTAARAAGVTTAIWGPDDSGPAWLHLAAVEPHSPYQVLTPHFYPLSGCSGPTPSIRNLLSDGGNREEQREAARFVAASRQSGLPVIVGETNSVACGGQPGVSNAEASALWAVDYGLVMAEAGVSALAFHIPLNGCNGYSPICLTGTGAKAHWRSTPEYQGLLVLANLEGARISAARIDARHDHLRGYSLLRPDGKQTIVVLDLDPRQSPPLPITWFPRPTPALSPQSTVAYSLGSGDYAAQSLGPAQPIAVTATTERTGVQLSLRPGTVTAVTR